MKRSHMSRIQAWDRAAGLLAVAVALGIAELAAAVLGSTSPVVGVGDVIVDYAPGSAVRAAIDVLGTADKPALLLTVTLAALAIGALLGPPARRRRWLGPAAFAAFGLAGALAAARDPLTPAPLAVVTATAAVLAGWWALSLLLGAAPDPDDSVPAAAQMPGRGTADRRRFFTFAGAAGVAGLAALGGRRLVGPPVDVEAEREAVRLPGSQGTPAARTAGFGVEGLSPLITPNDDFYRIDTALIVPRVAVDGWRLRVTGMVDRPYELTLDELVAMASLEQTVTLACVSNEVGGDLVGNAVWLGVPLAGLLERADVRPGATQVVGRSVDGFTVGFPTEVALDGRPAMVAVAMNGEPLPAAHGFPVRLVVPGLYGYVSATKWLEEIELTTLEAFDAYWIPRGWAKEAPIKTQARIDVPRDGRTVAPGRVTIAGVAWGGIRSISRVEVRIRPAGGDAGDGPGDPAEWREARLGEALSQSSWRQWALDWDAEPGDYRIEVRATDGDGETQIAERSRPDPDGATGYHRIRVTVGNA